MYTARPELGIKRTCAHCAVRFYDLGRAPAQCPACGATQPPPRARSVAVPRGGGVRWSARTAPVVAAAVAEDDAVPLLDTADSEDDADDDAVDDVVPDDAAEDATEDTEET
jgi:uncharacterized protein (TIGR02300 family)